MTLSVIGAGFGRTGTLSLKLALDQLGLGPCYHMTEVRKKPQAVGWWEDAADGKPVDWDRLFEGYGSAVDWPSATFYEQLAAHYPKAKVILTVRDPDSWFASTQETIFKMDIDPATEHPFARMVGKVVHDLFDRRMHDKDHLISVYERHNARVREVIAPERLLVYHVSEGWGPLCAFLGVAVPEGPTPRVNLREDFPSLVAAAAAAAAS